ncbi:MAG TPA: OmpA family protein [Methylocystis sp.]|nr:OmpA family protein [Methylocystis sp.]
MQHPKRWWIGLPILAGLTYFASESLTRDIEVDLSERAASALARIPKGEIDAPGVAISGRDIVLTGRALSAQGLQAALAALGGIEGARKAIDATTPLETAQPFALTLRRAERRVSVEGHIPSPLDREKLRGELNRQGVEVDDRSAYASGAPQGFADAAAFAARLIGRLESGVAKLSDAELSFEGTASADADIDKLVAEARAAPPGVRVARVAIEPARVSPFVWSAERLDQMILLKGFVPDAATRERLHDRATAIAEGAEVSDLTRVALGAPKGDFAAAAETALVDLQALARGKVTLTDNALRVEGAGRANVASAGLEAEARKRLPEGFELAALAVSDGPASPYLFSATARGGELTLSGHAPDAAAAAELLALAKRALPGLAVTDAISPASGAPEGFARAASAGLAALARLESGGLAISDRTLALTGVAPGGDGEAIGAELKQALPEGFAATVRISAKSADVLSPADAASLQRALDAQLAKSPIAFQKDQVEPPPASAEALAALAALLRRAGDATVEIVGHAPEPNIDEVRRTIAKRRAEAVAAALAALGVASERLSASAAAPPDDDPSRGAIEIKVKSQ